MPLTRATLAKMIDHALLKPEATPADLEAVCTLCARLDVASLCVRPCDVADAARLLGDSDVMVSSVAGFPHGALAPTVKAEDAAQAVANGAEEVDMVLNIGRLRGGQIGYVRDDIAGVVRASGEACVKVILECCYLDREQIVAACRAAVEAGARFVKTSTGFGTGGATVEDVALMRNTVGPDVGVKASGGIRSLADAKAMIDAGATRLGTSSTEGILSELPQ